jgi:hypothetical protein
VWSALAELGEEEDDGGGGAAVSVSRGGLLLAAAILRFLRRGVDWLNGRVREGT